MARALITKARTVFRRQPPMGVALALLYCLNVLALMRLDSGVISPSYLPDEAEYAVTGHNLLSLHAFSYEGLFPTLIPPLYPVVVAIGRLFAVNGLSTLSVSVLNHLLMEAVIFPAYALARWLGVRPGPAILAGLAAAWVPNMWEAGHYLAEVIYYPLFATSCVAILLYFQRPGAKRASIVGTVLGLALLTKNTGAALVLAWGLTNLGMLAFTAAKAKPPVQDFIRSAPFRAYLLWPLAGLGVTALLYGPWSLWSTISLRSCSGCSGEASGVLQAIRHPNILAHFLPLYAGDLFLSLGVLILPLALLGWIRTCHESRKIVEMRAQALFLGLIIVIVLVMAATYSGYTEDQVRDRHMFVLTPVLLALAGAGLRTVERQPAWKLLVGFTLVGAAEVTIFLAGSFTGSPYAAATSGLYLLNTPWVYGLGAWATVIAEMNAPTSWNVGAFIVSLVVVSLAAQLLWLVKPSLRAAVFFGITLTVCIAAFLPVLQAIAGTNAFARTHPYYDSGGLSQWLSEKIGPDQTLAFIGCDPLSPCFKQQSVMAQATSMYAYGPNYADVYYAEAAGPFDMVPVPSLERLPSVEAREHAAFLLSPEALTGLRDTGQFGIFHLYDLRVYRTQLSRAPVVAVSSSLGCFAQDLRTSSPPATVQFGSSFSVAVHIYNSSSCLWSARGEDRIVISYHWRTLSGAVIGSFINPPQALPNDLAPGQAAWVTVPVETSPSPGTAVLEIDMVIYRGAEAFSAAGGTPLRLLVHIVG